MSLDCVLLKPAIIKSPKGPLWTGAQLFQLALPDKFDYDMNGVLISQSEILVMTERPDWLGSSNGSLLQAIIRDFGGDVASKFLGSSQLMLVEWLSQQGFSVGPYDAYTTIHSSTRAAMKEELRRKMHEKENEVNHKLRNLNLQLNCSSKHGDQGEGSQMFSNLEKFGLVYMQRVLTEVEDAALKYARGDNAMLAMVTSGTKGSIKKFVEQFGFLGLQLYRGKYMHPIKKVQSFNYTVNQDAMPVSERQNARRWEEGALVKNSFVEGLNPREFFMHTVSHREAMIRQALRVSEPGYLYKNMMLFARDVYIDYDGTVRNHHDMHLIQFQYGGAKEDAELSHSKKQMGENQVSLPVCQWKDSVLAGEPVGILAATAIVQPSYQMLLETPNLLNDLAVCPLQLLLETLYTRKKSVLKHCDQRVVLYVEEPWGFSKELAAIQVHHLLQHITLEMLLSSLSVNFGGALQGSWEDLLPAKRSPWIVHLSLNKLAMNTWNVKVEEIVKKLKSTIEIHEFGTLSFFPRECCDESCRGWTQVEGNPCISFCTTTAQSPSIEESLSRMKNHTIPRAITVSIKGDWRIESVSIVPLDASSEPWIGLVKKQDSLPDSKAVVIEVLVRKECIRNKSDAWLIVQELCSPLLGVIDWSRSTPSSIQGIASLYGIEAAHSCVYQRLKSVLMMFDKTVYTQHVLLMTDLMTHSGNVIGLNAAGFREFSNAMHVSAPMTQSLFQSSIKHFQEAALKGKCDNLSGTLPSICWGKPAPVGTGANFDILWQIQKP